MGSEALSKLSHQNDLFFSFLCPIDYLLIFKMLKLLLFCLFLIFVSEHYIKYSNYTCFASSFFLNNSEQGNQ